MAGLPHQISTLLGGKSISFLRRANQVSLGRIEEVDVAEAFAQTVEIGGKSITANALDKAVQAIGEFPFMMQLVGYRSWRAAGESNIDTEHVRQGIALAQNDMKNRVLKATLDELSERDLDFLLAMLQDKRTSRTADIAARIDMTPGNTSIYRKRLLEQGVIEDARRGEVRFALPMLREYLPEYCS